jgi:hypothetical protein
MRSTGQNWTVGERWWAGAVTTGVVGATLWPLRQYRRPEPERRDGFPLSYYPMFSEKRGQFGSVPFAIGVRADGSEFNMPYPMLGPGGVNQVRRQLSRAVARGRAERHARMIAARILERPDCADVVEVRIVNGTYDYDSCLLDGKVTGEVELLVSVPVRRQGAEAAGVAQEVSA